MISIDHDKFSDVVGIQVEETPYDVKVQLCLI